MRDDRNALAKQVAELERKEYKPKNFKRELEDLGIVEKDGDFGEEEKLLLDIKRDGMEVQEERKVKQIVIM
ncbi:hypothetical protein J4E86_007637 [Alternaria arbusti]|uniref:uncharacterized protein n=1 Tax=Alternaria arbusti TaxID=232088 RepID=UPI00221E816B|nr:uncharacterized protein J4E86_007637 [Alternaria arbusti]KAI4949686.1 hypothetical protein J4E86_007637 [Alternaria arbusti]